MKDLTPFELWCEANAEFLKANQITQGVAEIIWYSAYTSTMHDVAQSIQAGTLKVKISF